METFYKITKEQASIIGVINYAIGKQFNPFVGLQKDGTYLVSSEMYKLLKTRAAIKRVDFTKLEIIDTTKLNPETIEIKK